MKDGWYKVTRLNGGRGYCEFEKIMDGHTFPPLPKDYWYLSMSVDGAIAYGFTFEPAVVMTAAEHEAAIDDAFARGLAAGNEHGYEHGFSAGRGLKG